MIPRDNKLRGSVIVWLIVSTVIFASPSFAQSNWIVTTGGTFDWADGSNWKPIATPPGANDDVRITNDLATAQVITNLGNANVVANNSTINFLAVSNGLGTASLTLLQFTNVAWTSKFGLQLGKNSTLILTTNAAFGIDQNSTFNTRAGGSPGTLVVSNAAILFLIKGAGGTTNPVVNGGTIELVSNLGQNSQVNYGQTALFTNLTTGTILKTGEGTGSFIGELNGRNRAFVNEGTIIASAGTMRLDPRDAFNAGGVRNATTGSLQVDTNAVLEIRRTVNAWNNGPGPTNFGTVFMNGGEWRTIDSDGPTTNTARIIINASGGVIRGNGLLDFTLRNAPGGIIEARDGTLTTVNAANNNGIWISTNFGGNASALNFATGGFDLGGGTLLNSNGTLRLSSGANMTLSTSYRQNRGTIDFAGAGNLWIANSASADSFTNEFVIKKTGAGISAIITGYGSGQPNYGFYNRGTLDLSTSGRFSINTSNAFSQPFQNSGNIFIGNVTTLRIVRTSAAWGAATAPTNSGTITLSGGVLETFDDAGLNTARFLRNTGTISGTGLINASITNSPTGLIAPGAVIGDLNITGNIVCLSNSALNIDLDTVSTQCDLLAVGGNVTLNSDSRLNIVGGVVGNVYTVMTYAARSGVFGTNSPGYALDYLSSLLTISPIQTEFIITATPGNNGTISPSGSVIVSNGNDQTFNITPDTCYQIADVLVDGVSQGAASSITLFGVNSNHTISASFAISQYTVTASAGNHGTIDPAGAVAVNCGSDQLFNITADPSYHITDVLVDSASVGPVTSHTFSNVTGPHTISASFAIDTYTIDSSAGDHGTISPSGAVSVDSGVNQDFTITADSCYHVEDVLIDDVSVGPVTGYSFTNVVNGHTISASFAIDTFTINASAGNNGSINPSGTVIVNCGTNQDFSVTADDGYPVVDVLVDNISVGPVSSYSFTNVTANHTIDASIATNLFRILSITRTGSDLLLTWPAVGGHNYLVEVTAGSAGSFSNDFTTLNGPIAIPGIGESVTNYFDEGGATNVPARYYRIRLDP